MSELLPHFLTGIFSTPIGQIAIYDNGQYLSQIRFLSETANELPPTSALAEKTMQQLQCYFNDPDYVFSLPFTLQGTEFQKKVWQALYQIPSGATKTYSELAKEVNSHPRAIGQGCRTNPLLIVIPCHRVIAKTGLGGFMGTQQDGLQLNTKKWLLTHEAVQIIA